MKSEENTLNVRFLPYSNIQTDAILSLDDDVCLTQEQIVQGFRSVTISTETLGSVHMVCILYILYMCVTNSM